MNEVMFLWANMSETTKIVFQYGLYISPPCEKATNQIEPWMKIMCDSGSFVLFCKCVSKNRWLTPRLCEVSDLLLNLTKYNNPQALTWSCGCSSTGHCSISELQAPRAKPVGSREWQIFPSLIWHIDGVIKPCATCSHPPEKRHSPVTIMQFSRMELPLLGAFSISILVVPREKIGPVLIVKTRQSQFCGTLNWPLYWLLLSSVSDFWITSTWNINIPQAPWNNFTLQRNVTLQGEWWENVLEAIYTATWMDTNVIL